MGLRTVIKLDADLKDKIAQAAARRGMRYTEFIEHLLATAFNEGLIAAIMDDEG